MPEITDPAVEGVSKGGTGPTLDPFDQEIHPWCGLAAQDLQQYLLEQRDFHHDFGLGDNESDRPTGKMFGVLVVQNSSRKIGYLAAFSGKLAESNSHSRFVPPIYDSLAKGGFLAMGLQRLKEMTSEIHRSSIKEERDALIAERSQESARLQAELFDRYSFSNRAGLHKGLRDIFNKELGKNPPTAAGECAAPKLLQYAFDHDLKPIALAEFWWGASTRSAEMMHGEFYPPCEDKCRPILKHMLS